ncbi:hypothetical protein CI610_02444 [invertebrate metagenome]|uniref:Type II secretion system protein H n=1 Tax=invertebrate metagenome TaxID=1711999 RepID=A0A2H9T5Y4_9ZZZZ
MKIRQSSGFTLVEMLVIILIVGVLLGISLVTISTKSTYKLMQKEAERLELLFKQACDRALIEDIEYGFSIDKKGVYRWWKLPPGDRSWVELKDKPFQPVALPEDVLGDISGLDIANNNQGNGPSIVFFSDMQMTPFTLQLSVKNDYKKALTMTTDGLNRVTITK